MGYDAIAAVWERCQNVSEKDLLSMFVDMQDGMMLQKIEETGAFLQIIIHQCS